MDLQSQLDRAELPEGVHVTTYEEVEGRVFRVRQRRGDVRHGLEILLTDEAIQMYGEAPMVSAVLQQLKRHAEAGLPVVEAGQEYERLTFVGD